VITNIGFAHIGLFGSLDGVTQAKFEIADGLNQESGFMLLNGDDPRLVKEARRRKLRSFYFGFGAGCDLRAENVSHPDPTSIAFTVDKHPFRLAMAGRHFIYAALPAIFCGRRCGMDDASIAKALAEIRPAALRGAIEKRAGVQFIVDCYNANPSSMESALALFENIAPKNRRVAVLGDMLELGSFAPAMHKKLGLRLAKAAPRAAIVVGAFAKVVADAAVKAGMSLRSITTAADSASALEALKKTARRGDTVLLKASRGIKLEQVFEGF
jgi:UDP-N-acetylmuramoyl-tripeptide--D-alanyl-D-alanine ligase